MKNEKALQQDLLLIIGYLLTSAHGLYEEPPGYGPFRLVDVTKRLLAVMETHELNNDFLSHLNQTFESKQIGHLKDQELRELLNDLCLEYAAELKQQFPE